MLAELRIANLGVIGDATIEPGPGFTAVTGETGAGKTMIVTGLALLAGAKADPRLVRAGAARALVEGRWRVTPAAAEPVIELGADLDEGELLVARQLSNARSRMTIGGVQIPLATGQALVGEWLTIHGQGEQVRLATSERQRDVLDQFAGHPLTEVMAAYQANFARRRGVAAELSELVTASQSRAREIDMIRFGLDEVAKVDPQPGEDLALTAEARRLQAVDDLRQAVSEAAVALAGHEDNYGDAAVALSLVARARKALLGVVGTDQALVEPVEQLSEVAAMLADVASSLSTYLAGLDADPVRLEWIAGRRSELQHLTRRYGATVDAVLAFATQSAARLDVLDRADERIAELEDTIADLDRRLKAQAEQITALRQEAAARLTDLLSAELAPLGLPKARLVFQLTPLPSPGPRGRDQVSLLFSANPGTTPGPLSRVASGGELSRVRLALEVVLASESSGQTFVFDEVDAGVGGATALEIGRRLARLARHAQVVVVTHLAQVAAFADRHFVVSKSDDGSVTTSGVRLVQGPDRLAVLARMMGGLDTSESALAHAAELIEIAAS